MKKIPVFLSAATLFLCLFGNAYATTMWTGFYDPNDDLVTSTTPITQTVFLDGFNPATDKIGSAYAKLYLYDDELINEDDGADMALVNFTTSHVDQTEFEVLGDYPDNPVIAYKVQLIEGLWGLDDGSTPFTLSAKEGHDFMFDKIEYYAFAVPEPATMLILLSGGAVLLQRRKNLDRITG